MYQRTNPGLGVVSGGQAAKAIGAQAAIGWVLFGPIGAAAGAAVGAIQSLFGSNPNNPLKVYTTTVVNDIEPYMKKNVADWQASGKTCAEQQQYIANFNTLWEKVVSGCNNPQLGNPGKNCIADRQRGGQWDWFSYYLDPILNDSCVDAPGISSLAGSPIPLLLLGGLVLYAVVD